MEKYYSVLQKSRLFDGIPSGDALKALSCLGPRVRSFGKNAFIVNIGDELKDVGIVLSGKVRVTHEDELGNKVITAEKLPGQLFGEALVCANITASPVAVSAVQHSEVMFIAFKKLITVCTSACPFHTRLIENMLRLIANDNLMLNEKMDILTKKTTAEKLAAFLIMQRKKAGKPEFTIPFNREELADYLSVNRSAMSRELCKMRDDGLIEFSRNRFHLKKL